MAFKYVDVRDAQQHLQNSVVMYDGMPAYIHEINNHPIQQGSFIATIGHIPRIRSTFAIDLFDGRLDVRGIRLGYVNLNQGRALYLSRIPARQYKQGLCRANVNIPRSRDGNRIITFESLLNEGGFSDSLRGIYPSYDQAVGLLENPEIRSVAFDRQFALERDELDFYRLLFWGEAIGIGENGEFRLSKKHLYHKERLQELGVNVK